MKFQKVKVQKVSQTITPFAGISFVHHEFHQFNINMGMSELNIKLLLLTKQLEKGKSYDFDYDNQIIEHEKWDAKRTYK